MNSNFSKTLMVLLVCLTFVGQSVASTVMSYHMMSMKGNSGQEQMQNMSMMDHIDHSMMSHSSDDSDEAEDEAEDDCCVKSCSCFTGGCSSIATLIKDTGDSLFIDLSSKIFSYSNLAQSQSSSSLYRPPILS
ncbi:MULTISPECIES: CopL family metal-binding regulatory protein [unclassified Pseudoalteromonas]|uniref:CopL family metal-binding regulatory protein n=1 Tax=unclassified Pseudoalteromonas TaxID=194690 RepID=UPI001EE65A87|nr:MULTISPECIES: CopL family metal-binding regulatory protein [unclassified Pseudoalteromonas]